MRLLADTSALLAVFDRSDRLHARAAAFLRQRPGDRFVLTELVLAELATRLRARSGADVAVAIAADLLGSPRYQAVFVDLGLLREALALMARFADKRLSLTDCASFALIDHLKLDAAFSFDRDFRDCGYRVVPH